MTNLILFYRYTNIDFYHKYETVLNFGIIIARLQYINVFVRKIKCTKLMNA